MMKYNKIRIQNTNYKADLKSNDNKIMDSLLIEFSLEFYKVNFLIEITLFTAKIKMKQSLTNLTYIYIN